MCAAHASVKVVEGCGAQSIPAWVFQSSEPLVLKGLVSRWPLVKAGLHSCDEAVDYLQNFYSGKPVNYYYGAAEIKGRLFYNEEFTGFNFQRSEGDLRSLLNLMLAEQYNNNPSTFYVGSTRVDEWLPGFRAQNDLQLPFENPLVSVWLGNQSTVAAHYDCPDNIACNVVGKRIFTLFPPEQLENLYVGPLDITPSGRAVSLVDLANPDLEKFPKFQYALDASLSAELEAGDAIYIPGMWWHHVRSVEKFNVLVNYWWRRVPEYMGNPEHVLHHALLSLRSLPKSQRDIWKHIFDYYVFDEPDAAVSHIPEHIRGVLGEPDELLSRKVRSQLANVLKR